MGICALLLREDGSARLPFKTLVVCFQIQSLLTSKAVDFGLCQQSVIELATIHTRPPSQARGICSHTQLQAPRTQRNHLRHLGLWQALCKCTLCLTVPESLQAARQIYGSEKCGLVPGGLVSISG